MPENFLDLSTHLGQAWLAAASVERAVASPTLEANPYLTQEIARLAHAVKLLCEVIERDQQAQANHRRREL